MTVIAPRPVPPGSTAAMRLAALHATAFETPWDAPAFLRLLGQTGVFALETGDGFILMRVVADETEILTLAVRPEARLAGLAKALVCQGAEIAATRGATRLFLEVAEDNAAARALYARAGFAEAGRRAGYYSRSDGSRADALVLSRDLSERLP